MEMRSLVVLCLLAPLAAAKPLPLRKYDGGGFSIRLPRGWTLDKSEGQVVAKEKPASGDGARLIVTPRTITTATADQLLELLLKHLVKQPTNVRRGTRGKASFFIADGRMIGVDRDGVRIGAIAAIENGKGVVVLFVTRPDRFDALGGIDTANAVLKSFRGASNVPPLHVDELESGKTVSVGQPRQ